MLAHLLADELDAARFLWKRLPAEMRGEAELQALWNVGKQMWLKDHAGVQVAAGAFSWSTPLVARMVDELRRRYLEQSFCHLALAYVTVSADTFATKLGVPAATIHELATKQGWQVDPVTGAYSPTKPLAIQPESKSSMASLQQLTNYVAHLEQQTHV